MEQNYKDCIWGLDCGDNSQCRRCTDFSPINEEESKELFYIKDLEIRKETYAEVELEFGGVGNT